MRAILSQVSVETVEERRDTGEDLGGETRPRGSGETEADKIRRQQRVRLKTKLARRALAAHRTR